MEDENSKTFLGEEKILAAHGGFLKHSTLRMLEIHPGSLKQAFSITLEQKCKLRSDAHQFIQCSQGWQRVKERIVRIIIVITITQVPHVTGQ